MAEPLTSIGSDAIHMIDTIDQIGAVDLIGTLDMIGLIDLRGVSLETLLSLDGNALAEPIARILRQIDDPQNSFSDYNPGRIDHTLIE